MVQTLISDTKAYPWTQSSSCFFRGYIIYDGIIYREDRAMVFLEERFKTQQVGEALLSVDGVFSLIMFKEELVFFATDRVRALPLFYAFIEDELYISDSAHDLYEALPRATFDAISIEDYSNNHLFVTGPFTFYQEIRQVEAGQCMSFDQVERQMYCNYYFSHASDFTSKESLTALEQRFNEIFLHACNNLVLALAGRTAVVPLSGGADSRMVLFMLRSVGYDRVLCYSYGKKGCFENRIASQVAQHFGYSWLEIPYTRSSWRHFGNDRIYADYLSTAGNLASLPHVQDLLAVKVMNEKGILPEDSVFIPGHTGTVFGDGLLDVFFRSEEDYFDVGEVVVGQYKHRGSVSPRLGSRIKGYFGSKNRRCSVEAVGQYRSFLMKEEVAKFLVNSVRVYEFFGFEWLVPLCDLGFLQFFSELPLPLRRDKRFLRSFMGLDHIKSTGDDSFKKRMASLAHRTPLTRFAGRKLSVLLKYFGPLQVAGLYGLPAYISWFLFENENFDSNALAAKRYLALWSEKH